MNTAETLFKEIRESQSFVDEAIFLLWFSYKSSIGILPLWSFKSYKSWYTQALEDIKKWNVPKSLLPK